MCHLLSCTRRTAFDKGHNMLASRISRLPLFWAYCRNWSGEGMPVKSVYWLVSKWETITNKNIDGKISVNMVRRSAQDPSWETDLEQICGICFVLFWKRSTHQCRCHADERRWEWNWSHPISERCTNWLEWIKFNCKWQSQNYKMLGPWLEPPHHGMVPTFHLWIACFLIVQGIHNLFCSQAVRPQVDFQAVLQCRH